MQRFDCSFLGCDRLFNDPCDKGHFRCIRHKLCYCLGHATEHLTEDEKDEEANAAYWDCANTACPNYDSPHSLNNFGSAKCGLDHPECGDEGHPIWFYCNICKDRHDAPAERNIADQDQEATRSPTQLNGSGRADALLERIRHAKEGRVEGSSKGPPHSPPAPAPTPFFSPPLSSPPPPSAPEEEEEEEEEEEDTGIKKSGRS